MPRRCGAWATSSATAPSPTPASSWRASTPRSAWPATTTSACAARCRSRSSPAARRWRRSWTQETIIARDPRVPGRARAVQPRRGASASTTPARATRSGSTCSRRCRPSCASTSRPHRVCLIGHSHVALSFSPRPPAQPATGETRGAGEELDLDDGRVADQPGQRRPAARRRPARRLARARPRRLDGASTGAPSTTSPGPRRRSAPPGCPTRWPSACVRPVTAASRRRGSRPSRLTERQPAQPLKSGAGCAMRLAPLLAGGLGFAVSFARRLRRQRRPALRRPGERARRSQLEPDRLGGAVAATAAPRSTPRGRSATPSQNLPGDGQHHAAQQPQPGRRDDQPARRPATASRRPRRHADDRRRPRPRRSSTPRPRRRPRRPRTTTTTTTTHDHDLDDHHHRNHADRHGYYFYRRRGGGGIGGGTTTAPDRHGGRPGNGDNGGTGDGR